MATGSGADPGELLAKALDLAVGSVTLARYAAGQTRDRHLRRTFHRLASTGEHQASVLRRELADYALPGESETPWSILTSPAFVAGAAAGLAAVVVGAVALRVLLAPDSTTLRRATLRALAAVGLGDSGAPSPRAS